MRNILFSFIVLSALASCKEKCAECHKHSASGGTEEEFEICDKNKKDYEAAIKAAEADGFDCHEKLE